METNSNLITASNVGEVLVSITQNAIGQRDALLADGKGFEECCDTFTASAIATHVKELKRLQKACELSRTEVKKPVLALGREVDQLARDFTRPIAEQISRLQELANVFAKEQERIRQQAIEDNRRKAEAAQREAAEARRKAEEAEKAKATEAQDAAPFVPMVDPEKREVEQANAEVEAREKAEEAARLRSSAAQLEKAKATEAVAGMGTVTKWDFEIVDLMALLNHNRNLVDIKPRRAMILGLLKQGQEIPGVKSITTTEASIR